MAGFVPGWGSPDAGNFFDDTGYYATSYNYSTVNTVTTTGTMARGYNVFTGTTGTPTLTLPDSQSATGDIVEVKNRGTVTVTVHANATNDIYTTADVTSMTLSAGQAAQFVFDGTFWNQQ